MAKVSTAEIAQDKQDEPVSLPRKKTNHPVRDSDEDVVGNKDGGEGDNDDGDTPLGLSPEEVFRMIMTLLSVAPEVAGAALGLKRNASYAACKNGDIQSFKVGHKIVCPTAPLRRKLGIDPPLPGDAPTPQIAASSQKQELVRSAPKQPRRRR